MIPANLTVALVVTLLLGGVAPAFMPRLLARWGVIDVPNERSSHAAPAFRGVGLATAVALVAGLAVLLAGNDGTPRAILVAVIAVSAAVATLGWLEDIRGLPVMTRASLQVLIGLAGSAGVVVATGAPWWLVPLLAIAIAAYVNVANFMDGVNGMSGLHGVIVGVAYAVAGALTGLDWLTTANLVLAAAFLAFLPWNVLRGGMFLGDVGSYLLGGSAAVLAAAAIASGVSPVAVIAPLFVYVCDTGSTFIRRVSRGQRWHEAHRTHVYQRLTDLGFSHMGASAVVCLATALCAVIGLSAIVEPGLMLPAVAGLIVVGVAYIATPTFLGRRRGVATRGGAL